MYKNLSLEKDRFFSRLSTIRGIHPMPSIGDWILLQVDKPTELARRVNRRIAPGVMSVPRGIDGAVRVHVGEPKDNEVLFKTIREFVRIR
jgi:histidinol-phosphate/aromatic aminotransferase/cobyric acid decarboxylase-like protein